MSRSTIAGMTSIAIDLVYSAGLALRLGLNADVDADEGRVLGVDMLGSNRLDMEAEPIEIEVCPTYGVKGFDRML